MSPPPLNTWLDTLRAAAPVQGTILIGAGAGYGPLVQWLLQSPAAPTWLIEADESLFEILRRNLPARDGWSARHEVVAPVSEPVRFHQSNIPTEGSLIPASDLRALWPNLQAADPDNAADPQPGITLASLISAAPGPANWLMLDCLPAAALLQSAGAALARLDVILARVVTSGTFAVPAARHNTVDALLQEAGFRCVHLSGERHPSLALALYVRDHRAALAASRSRVEQQDAEIHDLKHRVGLQREELGKAEEQISLIKDLKRQGLLS
ncbi:MAG: hypothetical protein ABI162_14165 [Luteolibacter sp.]